MAHFYGYVRGKAGPADRTGTTDSGIDAWVQGWKSRLSVSLIHSRSREDRGFITIESGPDRGYGPILLAQGLNFDNILEAHEWDVHTQQHIQRAIGSLISANGAASKAIEKKRRLSEKAK